jgi:hypothetical protein
MLWPLVLVLLILAIGGYYGGITMLLDPTGSLLGVADALPLLPVPNFILPGLFLIAVMGLFPNLLAYALIARPNWAGMDAISRWSKHYWAWTGCIALVVILVIWLTVEVIMMGWWPITSMTAILGLLVFLIALLPGVRKHYTLSDV